MASAESYRDLKVWQRAIELSFSIYKLTDAFPRDEMHGLASQTLPASGSIASTIAEQQGRCTAGEFLQFLGMARGSNLEQQTQLVIAGKLGYGGPAGISQCERA